MFDYSKIDIVPIRVAIENDGYCVVPNLIDQADVQSLQQFWLDTFEHKATKAPTIWGPVLGETNKIHFHESEEDCLFRAYDFLWNTPLHEKTRELGIGLNRLRNRIVDVDERVGEQFSADGYGIYITVSYYPPTDGRMCTHQDQSDDRRHWHFILPLTFLGEDFSGGGNFIVDRSGNRISTDSLLAPGSVLFFDGGLTHGVDRIETTKDQTHGRMQMFSIPTFLESPVKNERIAETISVKNFIKAKLRPMKHRLTGIRGAAPDRNYF